VKVSPYGSLAKKATRDQLASDGFIDILLHVRLFYMQNTVFESIALNEHSAINDVR